MHTRWNVSCRSASACSTNRLSVSQRHLAASSDTYPAITRNREHPVESSLMSRAVQELYEKASQLTPGDRAELAGLLLESIDEPPDEGVEEVWAAEIERR